MGPPSDNPKHGLVLSGGGARGAYEVGVLAGILDVLKRDRNNTPPFHIFAGTSVGAINASFLASYAHRGDLGIERLIDLWLSLRLRQHLRVDPLGLWGWSERVPRTLRHLLQGDGALDMSPRFGRSLLDPRPLERIVQHGANWSKLRSNIARGRVHALLVAALEIKTGRTTIFTDAPPHVRLRATRDPRRIASHQPITSDHVLASAAIPVLFPARKIDHSYYCDGGLRFNTPIAPAIRLGAQRLVVISLMHKRNQSLQEDLLPPTEPTTPDHYPSLLHLAGKLLNAILLDPVVYDLQILNRFNRVLEVLEEALPEDQLQRFQDVIVQLRGAPYRRLDTLVFTPGEDIGEIAGDIVRHRTPFWDVLQRARERFANPEPPPKFEADWASYLLFDREFVSRLIDLGRRDALKRRDEILLHFSSPPTPQPT